MQLLLLRHPVQAKTTKMNFKATAIGSPSSLLVQLLMIAERHDILTQLYT